VWSTNATECTPSRALTLEFDARLRQARELQEQHGIVVGKDIGSLLEHALCWRLRNPRASESEREAWIAATAANYHAQRAQAASGRT